jgi:hypothetical protein
MTQERIEKYRDRWKDKLKGKYKVGDLWKLPVPFNSIPVVFRIIDILEYGITSECVQGSGNWEVGMRSYDEWHKVPVFFEDASKYRYLNSPLWEAMNGDKE